ncbi:MAG: beta-N-acetylhexosaminidase [Polyangiales bacterium]
MSDLERLAGGLIVCGFEGLDVPAAIERWLSQEWVAGLILFKRNIEDLEQAVSLVESFHARSAASLPLLVCVDQEGGRVARFGEPVLQLPPMRVLADAGSPELTRDAARVLARQLRAIGINLDFAPVLDVDTNPENPVIGDRAFGRTPEVVIEHGLAFADGLHAGGVLSCGKHFPGHGDTDLDSHLALPAVRHDRARLERVELAPFRAAADRLPAVMTAHVVFEAVDPTAPATMSSKLVDQVLRREMGFAGAIFSDDLEMKAVTERYPIEEAGIVAIEAGCDLLLVCSDLDATARLRDAIVVEADRNAAFFGRVKAARMRADGLRERIRTLPPAIALENALHGDEARSVRERLRQLA